jgi:hypothetical protein
MGRHRIWAVLAGLATLCLAGAAQAAPRNPELLFRDTSGDDEETVQARPLKLKRLEIVVETLGGVARTTLTAEIANPEDGDLEADLTLDLPADSVVTGYALDIDGKMIDGVLEAPRRARLAYEAVVRRGVDPGLGEVTRTNAFRTHISPVPAGEGRIVRLSFVTPFDAGRPYRLPLSVPEAIPEVMVTLRSADPGRPVRPGAGLPLAFAAGADGALRAEAHDVALDGVLELAAAPGRGPVTLSRTAAGELFYDITDAAPATPPRVGRVRIYWDASRSRADDDHAAEVALIRGFVAAAKPSAVELVELSDLPATTQSAPTDPEALARRLAAIGYRGGTSYAGLARSGAEVCFLVSDGRPTLDAYGPRDLGCRLIAVSAAREADGGLLDALARASGGMRLDLAARPVEDALAQAMQAQPAVAAASDGSGGAAPFTALAAARGTFRVVGPAPEDGTLRVRLSDGSTRSFRVAGEAVAHDGAAALWAAGAVAARSASDRPDGAAVLALSRRYGVAGPQASFIVLEDAYDYARNGVTPPAIWGDEFLEEYAEARKELDEEARERRTDRLASVVEQWEAQKKWWRERYRTDMPADPSARRPGRQYYTPGVDGLEEIVVTGSYSRGPSVSMAVEPWDPKRPYLDALRAAPAERFWTVYDEQAKVHGGLPAYYLDVAEYLFRAGRAADARRVLGEAAELPSADTSTLTTLAERFGRYGDRARSMWLYERIAYLEPDRPQPMRNLALALIDRAERPGATEAGARADYRRALELLGEVVLKPWNGAFDGIDMISLMEANRIIPKLAELGVRQKVFEPRLVARLDVDIRVVLDWNTDATDMDLWIDEPNGERAFYGHQLTTIGGHMSNDMTGGYGPEEYLLRRAAGGTYEIRIDTYATDQLNPNGTTTVRGTLFRNYGRANEARETFEIDLKDERNDDGNDAEPGDNALLGRFTVKR